MLFFNHLRPAHYRGISMNHSAEVDNATLEALDSPFVTVVVPVIYMLVFVISTPCNVIALCLLCGLTKRSTPTIIYSINLCLADLLYSIILPLQVDYHFHGNNWRFGMVTCNISTAAFYCNLQCSVLTTCAIALERYCGIVHPLKTHLLWSPRKAVMTCCCIWGLVLALQLPFFLFNFTLFIPQLNITTCFDVLPKAAFEGTKGYLYFITIYLVFYVVPLVLLVVCSCAVVHALRRTLDAGVQRSHRRVQVLVMVSALCFIICYLPNMVIQPLHMVYRHSKQSLYAYYKLTLSINSLNCCFDPFVYYLASRELRQALRRALGRWGCCPGCKGEEPVTFNLSELPSCNRVNQTGSRALLNQCSHGL
ncbi:P2Y purinoceptor 8-like isoform X2 [Electrophorus electricus]|uniref:P2Y purinoceptor 8-like isoform X2 n=1 Tax=Electrophorus electricus TaxID=8005 RepID=UPI0015CFEF81|nr:P2Y purinoceptor 8-like isoform X2 [Electrophorus electricus]